jgi:hypothetical protein
MNARARERRMANTVTRREISRVWTVKPEQVGPGHTVAMVLEPGHWQEFDPFLMLAEDWFCPALLMFTHTAELKR